MADERLPQHYRGGVMISVLIGVLIVCVVGAICFWAIDKVREGCASRKPAQIACGADLSGVDPSAGAAAGGDQLAVAS